MGRLAWISSLALLVTGAASASELLAPGPESHGQQWMLYLKRPIGAVTPAGHPLTVYGLRLERTSPAGSDAAQRFSAAQRHSPMIDLQLTRHDDARVNFGNRLTWDLTRRELAATSR